MSEGPNTTTSSPTPDGHSKEMAQVGRGAAAFLAGSGVSAVSGLARVILLTRVLGATAYGSLILAVTVTSLVSSLAGLGLQLGVTRMMALARGENDRARATRLFHAAIAISVLSGVVGSVIVLAITWAGSFRDPATHGALLILAPIVVVSGMRPALFGALRAVKDLRSIFFLGIVTPLIDLGAIGVVLLAGKHTLGWFAFALLMSATTDCILTAWLVRRRLGPTSLTDTTWVDAKALLAFSLPLLVTQVMFIAIQRSDVLLLGIFKGPDATGLYAPVMRLVEASQTVLAAFPLLYVPIVAGLVAKGQHARIRDLYLSVTKWGYFAGFSMLLPLLIAPSAIFGFLFGPEWRSMETVARVLAVGYWTTLITGLNGVTLSAIGEQKRAAFWSSVGGIVNLGLGLLLIPRLGPSGAAWSNTLSYIFINTMFSILLFSRMKIGPFRRDTTRLFLFSLAVAAAGLGLARLPVFASSGRAIGLATGVTAVWCAGAVLLPGFQMRWRDMRAMIATRGSREPGQTDGISDEQPLGPAEDIGLV